LDFGIGKREAGADAAESNMRDDDRGADP
jgi:hypothetical protein